MEQVLRQIEITYSNGEEKGLYTNKVGNIIRVDFVEKVKMAKITPKSVCNTFFQSKSRIQSTHSRFKLIKFDNIKRKQAEKLVEYKDIGADIINILAVKYDNCLPFKKNVEYIWARFT